MDPDHQIRSSAPAREQGSTGSRVQCSECTPSAALSQMHVPRTTAIVSDPSIGCETRAHLFLIYDAGGANAFNVCAEGEERLDLLFGNVIGHDDRWPACQPREVM